MAVRKNPTQSGVLSIINQFIEKNTKFWRSQNDRSTFTQMKLLLSYRDLSASLSYGKPGNEGCKL